MTLPLDEMLRHCPADVERFVMARDVVVALVKRADVENKEVDVAFVMIALVAPREVVVEFVNERLVPDIAVVEAKLM